jgi:hypothetical protein
VEETEAWGLVGEESANESELAKMV